MTYPASIGADEANLGIESSPDLVTWSDASPFAEEVSRSDQGDGRTLVTTRFAPPIGTSPKQFLRLKVERR